MTGQVDPLRVVNDAIENGVSVGGIADQLVPFVDRDLAGDDRRSPTVAFFEDFEEVVAGGGTLSRKMNDRFFNLTVVMGNHRSAHRLCYS